MNKKNVGVSLYREINNVSLQSLRPGGLGLRRGGGGGRTGRRRGI